MKIIDNIFSWIGKKLGIRNIDITNISPGVCNVSTSTYNWRYEFEVIGNVLIVHIPTGRMPSGKAEEHVKKLMVEVFVPAKESFGVSKIIGLANREH